MCYKIYVIKLMFLF